MCVLQLEEQVSSRKALEEEHAAVEEALEGAKSGIEKLTSRCTNLEAELAKMEQVSQSPFWMGISQLSCWIGQWLAMRRWRQD